MVMSRERKAKKGLGGGLDESQGIPELATYTRGPQMPFLRFLCRLRQVSFELKPGSEQPWCPPPALLTTAPCRYRGTQRSLRGTRGL